MTAPFCVCVPARDEAARLPVLLAALAAQTVAGRVAVALCVNNSRDDSVAAIERSAATFGDRLAIQVDRRDFPPALAHAGSARGAAMEAGAAMLGRDDGVLISTDADCRPPPGWIAAILAAMAPDRIVGGRIAIDEDEPLSAHARAVRARLDRYWADVRAIEDAVDPCPWDRPPRHGDHTGASLALTVGLYRAAGGVPPIACGEDRALVGAACLAGGRLVHPPTVWTRASPRSEGRAAGGMAAAMATLASGHDAPAVPDFAHWNTRAAWRRDLRKGPGGDRAVILGEPNLPPMPCDMALPG